MPSKKTIACPSNMYFEKGRCCYNGKPKCCLSRLDSQLYDGTTKYTKLQSPPILSFQPRRVCCHKQGTAIVRPKLVQELQSLPTATYSSLSGHTMQKK